MMREQFLSLGGKLRGRTTGLRREPIHPRKVKEPRATPLRVTEVFMSQSNGFLPFFCHGAIIMVQIRRLSLHCTGSQPQFSQ